jgi:hypothetical protein
MLYSEIGGGGTGYRSSEIRNITLATQLTPMAPPNVAPATVAVSTAAGSRSAAPATTPETNVSLRGGLGGLGGTRKNSAALIRGLRLRD